VKAFNKQGKPHIWNDFVDTFWLQIRAILKKVTEVKYVKGSFHLNSTLIFKIWNHMV